MRLKRIEMTLNSNFFCWKNSGAEILQRPCQRLAAVERKPAAQRRAVGFIRKRLLTAAGWVPLRALRVIIGQLAAARLEQIGRLLRGELRTRGKRRAAAERGEYFFIGLPPFPFCLFCPPEDRPYANMRGDFAYDIHKMFPN